MSGVNVRVKIFLLRTLLSYVLSDVLSYVLPNVLSHVTHVCRTLTASERIP